MDHTLLPSAPVDLLESVTSLSKQWHAPPAELMSAIGYGSQLQNPCVTLSNNLIPAATAAPWMQWPLGNFPFICSGDYRPLAIQQALIMKQPSWSSILSPAFCPLPTEVNSQMPKKTQEGCIENRIKKPLNAFMLFMKEMRSKVLSECPFKESAAINQILARRWHALSKEEQAPYYEMARQEKELHSKLHPDWSARDNYGTQKERKMKKRMEVFSLYPGFPASNSIVNWTCDDPDKPSSSKKCRARLGITQQERWCRSCRLKKKCARFSKSHESSNESNAGGSSNNFIDISNIVPFLPPYIPDHWKLPNKTPITLQ